MPSFRLDFEEWHELYLAAMAVPEAEQRPCLKTAILGLARVLAECHLVNPNETSPILEKGYHECEKAECEKALETAVTLIRSGSDPFAASAADEEHGEVVLRRLDEIEAKIDRLAPTEEAS